MEKLNLPKIDALPQLLVTPERFQRTEMTGWGGEVAVAQIIRLPETARLYSPDVA